MSDINSDLLTQEVDDEVRRERMRNFWKAYGKYVIGGAVAIVALVSGNEGFKAYERSVESGHSSAFAAALDASTADEAGAVEIWEKALPDLGAGYGALARLRIAGAAVKAENFARALEAYDALAADSKADTSLRDFARLQAGMLVAGKMGDADAARGRLAVVAIKGNAWYFSAQEQLALIDLAQNDLDAALQKFSLLADDAESPRSVSARARQFRSFIEAKQAAMTPMETPDEVPVDAPDSETTAAPAADEGEAQ